MKGDYCKSCECKFNNNKNYIKHVVSGHKRMIGRLQTKKEVIKQKEKDNHGIIKKIKGWLKW